jgi:hypothetical protein
MSQNSNSPSVQAHRSYYECISIAQRQAMRDIDEEGQFNNPYNPITDSLAYESYRVIEALWGNEYNQPASEETQ